MNNLNFFENRIKTIKAHFQHEFTGYQNRGQIAKDFKYELVGDFGASASSSAGSDTGMSNTFTGTDVAYVDYA